MLKSHFGPKRTAAASFAPVPCRYSLLTMTYDVQPQMPVASFMKYKLSKTKTSGVETQFTPTSCASRRKTELVRNCAVTQHIAAASETTGNRKA